ncbi:MAG: hypothetical protein WC285_00900 [Candidatus Gracilibacteria bacterium]|jgi:hypothetical protein
MKKLQAFVALTIVMALIGGCALSPEKAAKNAIREATANFLKVSSANYELVLNGALAGTPDQQLSVSFDAKAVGVYDKKDPKKPQFATKITGGLAIAEQPAQNFDVELRLNTTDLYANLFKVPALAETFVPKKTISAIANKWWTVPVPAGAFDQMPVGGAQDEATKTPEQKASDELFKKTDFFKDLKLVGEEALDGVNCLHYNGNIDKEASKTFIVESSKINGKTLSETELKDLDSFLKSLTAPVDMWIDSSNSTLVKVASKLSVVPENGGSLTLDLSFKVSNLDKEVKIDVPKGATLFDPSILAGALPLGN